MELFQAVAAVTDAGAESDSGDSEDDEEKKWVIYYKSEWLFLHSTYSLICTKFARALNRLIIYPANSPNDPLITIICRIQQELSQNFTIRSIAKFMSSNRDVYNGDFGRVELRKSDL